MSKKKWGKTTQKTERLVRDSIPKTETLEELDQYITKARSFTEYDLANKFGIRMSVARRILHEKEAQGKVVPYVRESGFAAYTTPSEAARREGGRAVPLADVLEEVARSVPASPVITEEMELALAAASVESLKPSKLARQRREAGVRKERERDKRPEVIVEPLPGEVAAAGVLGERAPEPKTLVAEKRAEVTTPSPKVITEPVVSKRKQPETTGGEKPARKSAAKKAETAETKKVTKKTAATEKPAKRPAAKKSEAPEGKKTTKKAASSDESAKKPAAKKSTKAPKE